MNFSKLFVLGSVVAFVAAAIGSTVFGHNDLELVAAGLALYVSADLVDDIVN